MPIVRVDIIKNADSSYIGKIGKIIYQAMRTAINVPDKDNFQILNEHARDHFVYDPKYLGIQRTDQTVIIQITLNEGRTVDQKKALYKTIADQLAQQLSIPKGDVFISLVEVKKENWSFGNGIAQYAE
ncbi:tautomerase family protein [Ewingella americana]|uniref:tautomerase family protein n=1 Tax=Ewingella americana TaxID=41202 RepID=UPI00163A10ED|nr:tautomerase family protein [Ewingella americana]QMV52048.1 tautomerase family protein [Ewingella americana]